MKALRLVVWWCVLLPLALVLLTTLAGCTEAAPPMSGNCKPILPKRWEGSSADGPTRECLWSGRRWECTLHNPSKLNSRWICNDVGEAPAEMVK